MQMRIEDEHLKDTDTGKGKGKGSLKVYVGLPFGIFNTAFPHMPSNDDARLL